LLSKESEVKTMKIAITSNEFASGEVIPVRFTCDGQDISPPLRWGQAPEGTKSFALLVEDPDAPSGTFDHWVLFNIPPVTTELSEGIPNLPVLDYGMKQGVNGFKRIGYGGPCPPRQDDPHHYFFRIYALEIELPIQEGASKDDVRRAMEGHIIAEGVLVGTYARMNAGGKTSGA
jgi:Raf kinase inhibitor-like YbhB/YbcL family protein